MADTHGQLSVTSGSVRAERDGEKSAPEEGRQRMHGKKCKNKRQLNPEGFLDLCTHRENMSKVVYTAGLISCLAFTRN